MSLTRRQKMILDYVRDFMNDHGYSPTLEEIAAHFKLASLNGVYKHLRNLESRGFIERRANQSRSISLREKSIAEETALPLLGYVAAGQPIEAIRTPETIHVPEEFLTRGRNYVLRVRGDSMIEEHIEDGDLVIVEERQVAHNGEMVIALVDGEDVTLKKFYREGDQIRLQPANPTMSPLYLEEDRVRVQGVLVGLMRKFA